MSIWTHLQGWKNGSAQHDEGQAVSEHQLLVLPRKQHHPKTLHGCDNKKTRSSLLITRGATQSECNEWDALTDIKAGILLERI